MNALLVVVAVAVGGWLTAELVVATLVDAAVNRRRPEGVDGPTAVSGTIDSFPLATRLVATGRVRRLRLTLHEVVRGTLTFATVDLDLEEVELDRRALVERRVVIRRIARGSARAEITAGRLSDLVDRAVELSPVTTTVEVGEGAIALKTTGLPAIRLPMPTDLLPGRPTGRIADGRLVVTATFTDVPQGLIDTANRALSGGR